MRSGPPTPKAAPPLPAPSQIAYSKKTSERQAEVLTLLSALLLVLTLLSALLLVLTLLSALLLALTLLSALLLVLTLLSALLLALTLLYAGVSGLFIQDASSRCR